MKKRLVTLLIFLIILAFQTQTIAQFKPEEIAEDEKWEDFLMTAEVVDQKQMSGREAVTSPWKLSLEKEGINRDALWKNPEGRMKGFVEGWKYEIASYRLDRYLGLNMVPVTVEKEFQGNRGSCQLWITAKMDLRKKVKDKIKTPSYKVWYWNNATYLHRAFDNLIANEDRHQGNILITDDWRMILIDHSRSFRTDKKFTNKLIYTEKHKEGPKLMRKLPRAFFDKLKTLNFEVVKGVVGEYLTDKEIEAVITRKDLILKEIDKFIKKYGEDDVLY
ncbi:MAG: hypothetical protein ACETWK_06745 [Candidatus Aminicenantaceae bacterium]